MKVFVPVTEGLIEKLGLSLEDLVPFDLEYEILRPGEAFPDAGQDEVLQLAEV